MMGEDVSPMVKKNHKSLVGGFSKREQSWVLSDRSHFSEASDVGGKWRGSGWASSRHQQGILLFQDQGSEDTEESASLSHQFSPGTTGFQLGVERRQRNRGHFC